MQTSDPNNDSKGQTLFDLAVEEYFDQQPTDVPSIEGFRKRAHKALEMDPSLRDTQQVVRFMGNLCSLLGWFCLDEELNDKARSYCQEAIGFLEQLDDPCWHEYWYLGKALDVTEEHEKAVQMLTLALEMAVPGNNPDHEPSDSELAALWSELADVYIGLERPSDAKESLEWALSYAPDDEAIRNALVIQCLNADEYDQILKVCHSALNRSCENPRLFTEYIGIGAALAGDLDLAQQTYRQLLNDSKNGQASEWYAGMVGYLEGLADANKGLRAWEKEDWEWELHEVGGQGAEATPLDGVAEKLREEVRDSVGRISLQVLQLREEMGRLPALQQERLRTRARLRQDVFGDLWTMLQKPTQEALVEADCRSADLELSRKDDCSSAFVMFQKAVEIEMGTRVMAPFQSFLISKGFQKWNIASEPHVVRHLSTLDLRNVRHLLIGWRLSQNRRWSVSEEERRCIPTDSDYATIHEYLERYSPGQLDLLLNDVVDFLSWAPTVGIEAKHRGKVAYDDLTKLRKQIIGSQVQPGIFVRLVQMFPTKEQDK